MLKVEYSLSCDAICTLKQASTWSSELIAREMAHHDGWTTSESVYEDGSGVGDFCPFCSVMHWMTGMMDLVTGRNYEHFGCYFKQMPDEYGVGDILHVRQDVIKKENGGKGENTNIN